MTNVNDIYTIVNSAATQSLGAGAIQAINLQTLIDLGNSVLSSSTDTDNFYSTLVQRIGRTILAERPYSDPLADVLRRDQMGWGQIMQKISADVIDAETDQSLTLTQGQSVDQYKVNKADLKQKLFKKSTAYQWKMTYQRQWLKQAFLSAEGMGALISLIQTSVANSQAVAEQDLTLLCIDNLCAELDGTARQINLLSLFNTAFTQELTVENALFNADFLRYASSVINTYALRMRQMNKYYNDGTVARHTPESKTSLFVGAEFDSRLKAFGYATTFNADYMKLRAYEVIPSWQDLQTPNQINVNRASDGTATKITYQLALLADYDALGTYRHDLRTYNSPFNAAGEYFNQFVKAEDMYFNDLSEQAVSFVLE